MYNEMYPAPQVNWYADNAEIPKTLPNGIPYPEPSGGFSPNGKSPLNSLGRPCSRSFAAQESYLASEYGRPAKVMQSPSFFTAAAAEGFPRATSSASGPQPSQLNRPASSSSANGAGPQLIVNVDTALDLPADSFGPHSYRATAHYVGESEDQVLARQTPLVKANASKTSTKEEKKENCVLHKRIQVPYNSRQQFLMVDILDGTDQIEDTFIGQATLPLADPRLASTAPWPLIRDGVQTGVVTLNVQIPGDTSPTATGVSSSMAAPLPDSSWSPSSPSKSPAALPPRELSVSGSRPHYNTPYGTRPPSSWSQDYGNLPRGGSHSTTMNGLGPTDTVPWSQPSGRPPLPPSLNGLGPTDTMPWRPPATTALDPFPWRPPAASPMDTMPWRPPAASPMDTMPWRPPAAPPSELRSWAPPVCSPTDTMPWRPAATSPTDTMPWRPPEAASAGGPMDTMRGRPPPPVGRPPQNMNGLSPTDTMPWGGRPSSFAAAPPATAHELQTAGSFPAPAPAARMSPPRGAPSTPPRSVQSPMHGASSSLDPLVDIGFPKIDLSFPVSGGTNADMFSVGLTNSSGISGAYTASGSTGSYLAPPAPYAPAGGGSTGSYMAPPLPAYAGNSASYRSPPMPLLSGGGQAASWSPPPSFPHQTWQPNIAPSSASNAYPGGHGSLTAGLGGMYASGNTGSVPSASAATITPYTGANAVTSSTPYLGHLGGAGPTRGGNSSARLPSTGASMSTTLQSCNFSPFPSRNPLSAGYSPARY